MRERTVGAMNTPPPDAPLSLWVVALATAFVTFLQVVLTFTAPRTKTTVDDTALSWLSRILAWLKKLNPLGVLAVVALAGVIAAASVSCKSAGQTAGDVIAKVPPIDCTILDASKADMAKAAVVHVLVQRPGDWKAAAEEAAAYGAALGGCALAKLVQAALSTRGATTEQWGAHDALEAFRAEHAGGASFQTEAGYL